MLPACVLASMFAVASALRADTLAAAKSGSTYSEPIHAKALRIAATAAAAALIAQLLLSRGRQEKQVDLPADPNVTLREDFGVTKVADVHISRAKNGVTPPILEGSSREGTGLWP